MNVICKFILLFIVVNILCKTIHGDIPNAPTNPMWIKLEKTVNYQFTSSLHDLWVNVSNIYIPKYHYSLF